MGNRSIGFRDEGLEPADSLEPSAKQSAQPNKTRSNERAKYVYYAWKGGHPGALGP